MPDPTDTPNLWDQSTTEYPILKDQDVQYKESFGRGSGYLESWPPNEEGSDELKRPEEFPMDKFGVEVYDRTTRPIDVLGDVVSHRMVDTDPVIKDHYQKFKDSVTPDQENMMKNQYAHAQKTYGDTRSYDDWKNVSGLPGYFRGYAFKQWDDAEQYYTKDQIKNFDSMNDYLKKKK